MLVERLSPLWSSTGLTPFLGRPGRCGYFYATLTEGHLTTTIDLTCNRPHTRRIFSGSGFEPGTLQPQSRDLTTRPPRPFRERRKGRRKKKLIVTDLK
ncbi:hypothetical protein AVEN_29448-1 [Araneus ventricosus]|uniref:Uncharacterized protein n=1 Tax=Araneus ventricosus TaxID=182803 RepID=A0A4Y2CYN9_ARAVE|nr:hypothetical protein AVEN_29448-1 [Araneus ventricosus]